MTAVTPFMFEAHAVRVVMRDDEPWFVAADVCAALGIRNNRDALEKLDVDEKGVGLTDTPGGEQQLLIISESGLYTLALRCREATTPGTVPHRFKRWVTHEVLPALRRTGTYRMADAVPVDPDWPPDWRLDGAAEREVRLAVDLVREARLLHGRAAAKALWRRLPLPPVDVPDVMGDPVGAFLADCCRLAPIARTAAADLYRAYDDWRRGGDGPPISVRAFGAELGARPGIRRIKDTGGRIAYSGVDLVVKNGLAA